MTFSFHAFRFGFRATESVYFPEGKAGNVFRGAFGTVFRQIACNPACHDSANCSERKSCPYARMFEPRRDIGPSGLSNPPRPFVLRAAHLDGRTLRAGDRFHLDAHIFDVNDPSLEYFIRAFTQFAHEGLGPGRGRVELESVDALDLAGRPSTAPSPLELSLLPGGLPVTHLQVRFLTPTELKGSDYSGDTPEFELLFARIRDRVSTLRALYGAGALDLDFRGLAERARSVRMIRSNLRRADVARRSSRTGDVHGIGGLVGEVDFEGQLEEFVPFLTAGKWVGVGRHAVWGNGVIQHSNARIPERHCP